MDNMEDDSRYPSKGYPLRRKNPNLRQKHPIRNLQYQRFNDREEDFEDDEPEEFADYNVDEDGIGNGYVGNFEENVGFVRKKRKMRSGPSGGCGGGGGSVSNYELLPWGSGKFLNFNRGGSSSSVHSSGSEEWTEHATFVLLEIWGEKFLQIGRNSLRSEEWHEVAEKVSEELKVERNVAQCRIVLDKVKRRYKKEKSRMDEMGLGLSSCKWPFFKKMDMLMSSSARQEYGLACGVDSGEYVFMNTRVYLNRSNGFDEMRDSPGESESSEDDDDDEDEDFDGDEDDVNREEEEASYRILADSIQKFGNIYEKIENTKRQQMMELEKVRLDFNRELELQKKQILDRAKAEISKIQEAVDDADGDDEDTDTSTDNLSE